MLHPERFYMASKNLCTFLYTENFLAVRNHSGCSPETPSFEG